ncbi:hypothetical protein ABD87_00195 [Lysinibacillus sphaericus]|uniref:Ig-like domain-containing protein n=1 Tax=Lysinibacillus sphaericus TaxID=1421 RepID=UPI0018CD5DCA|nr:Ig-like domain-containing protein [Lysinibacillus sphaericus]MBG9728009.1 hypothetical protein [Lysinibacillus sphaericus]
MKEFSRKIAIVMIAILLLLMNVPPSMVWNDDVEKDVQAAAPSKPTGSSGSYRIDAVANKIDANPSVYWTQIDNLSFTAVSDGGTTPATNSGNNEPVATEVKNTLDLTNYPMPTTFKGSDGKIHNRSELTRVYLKDDSVTFKNAQSFKGISLKKASDTKFTFLTETGSPNRPTAKTQYGQNSDGKPKFSVRYDTPIDIVWYGEIEKQAEMRVVEDSSLPVGAKKTFKAQVRINGSTWKDVSAYQWSSDASSIATVSSNGEVTTKAIGNANITASWKDDNFHLQASATVKVIGDNGLAVTGSSTACFKDGSTTLKATLYKNGVASDVTNTATWSSSDDTVATVSKGVVTFKKVGSTKIKATSSNMSDVLELSVTDCSVPPVEEDPNPPTVEIYGPNKVKAGEEFQLYANASVEGGTIDRYEWDYPKADGGEPKDANLNNLYYLEEGEKYVTVAVEDNQNRWAYDDHTIEVTPPTPSASMKVGGTLKENRKVKIDSNSSSPKYFPITESYFTIEPLEGQSIDSIYTLSTKISKTDKALKVSNEVHVELLFKETGKYKVYHYVRNKAGLSDDTDEIITIEADQIPKADFTAVTTLFREDVKEQPEHSSAVIKITDKSSSPDDKIGKRIWTYKYDSNNDGNFNDEESVLIDDTNKLQVEIPIVEKVGKYQIELEVFEDFMQPTIEEFVDLSYDKTKTDRRNHNTRNKSIIEKTIEVKNLAPVVSYDVNGKDTKPDYSKIDLTFGIGDTVHSNQTALESKINSLMKPRLNAEGISISSLKFSSLRPTEYKASENVWEFYYGLYGFFAWNYPRDVYVNISNSYGSKYKLPTANHIYKFLYSSDKKWKIYGKRRDTNVFEFVKNDELATPSSVDHMSYATFREFTIDSSIYSEVYRDDGGYSDNGYVRLVTRKAVAGTGDSKPVWEAVNHDDYPTMAHTHSEYGYTFPTANHIYRIPVAGYGFESYDYLMGERRDNGKSEIVKRVVDDKEIDVEIDSSIYKRVWLQMNQHSTFSRIDRKVESIPINTNLGLSSSNRLQFATVIEDKEISSQNRFDFLKQALLNDAYLSGLGRTATNKSHFEEIIKKNMNRGTFIDNTNLDSALIQYADYIIAEIKRKSSMNEAYITLDEEVDYTTTYMDAEKDPKLLERWRYEHEPNVFENNMGIASFSGKDLETPIMKFQNVGRYQPFYAAKDDPLNTLFSTDSVSLFDNYRLWSKESSNWYIYVHRKPIADFFFKINQTTGNYTITNKAYDLDKQSIDIGFGGGIKKMSYTWREKGQLEWKNGLPTNPLQRKIYEVRQEVEDFQGAKAYVIKLMDATGVNSPPIADFEPTPNEIMVGETTKMLNKSYDPNGDNMTGQWFIKKTNGADSTYKMLVTGAYTDGIGNANWHPTLKNLGCDNTVCSYTIKLVVTDQYGASDETTREVKVKNDIPKEIENPVKNVSGQFYWELKRKADTENSIIQIHMEPQLNSNHAAIRNIRYGYEVEGRKDLSVSKEVSNLDEIKVVDKEIKNLKDVKDIQGKNITFFVEYEFTNYYLTKDNKDEPVWEEYTETFKLFEELPNKKNDLTILLDHSYGKVLSMNDLKDDIVTKGFIVGRDISIDMKSETEKVKHQQYREYLSTEDSYTSKFDLKSQTRLPIWLPNMDYKVHVPSQNQHNADYKAFKEGLSTGSFNVVDIDSNLRDKYENESGTGYSIPLQQTNIKKESLVDGQDKNSLAEYHFDYVTDLFFVAKHTGFVHAKQYAQEKANMDQESVTWDDLMTQGNDEMKTAYKQFTGEDLVDSLVSEQFEDTQYYYLPVSLSTRYKPENNYANEYKLNDIGLNEITLEFKQTFSFENYLFGDVVDNPIFTEQQIKPVQISNYPHVVNLSDEKMLQLKEYYKADSSLIHEFRFAKRNIMNQVKDLLK